MSIRRPNVLASKLEGIHGLSAVLCCQFKTDAIIEQLQELRETLKKVGFNEPRPWREFFAVFKPPKKWRKQEIEEVRERWRSGGTCTSPDSSCRT